VSIDGHQAGPFTLADAQRWVASKPFASELHCWSEGFDDWLPVDKVSHFRGLRKQPPPQQKRPTIPPPIPAPAPKPLFASTMASIEKAAKSGAHRLPVAAPAPTMPMNGVPIPSLVRPAVPVVQPFKTDDAPTTLDQPAFNDEPPAREYIPPAMKHTVQIPLVDDDSLDIGEVSRVVHLAEIGQLDKRTGAAPVVAPTRPTRPDMTGPHMRHTGSMPKISPAALGMRVDPSRVGVPVGLDIVPDESLVAKSFAQRHRRGMMLLIAGSAVMVLGVVALVAFVTNKDAGSEQGSLGGARVIDTSRPEDIVREQAGLPPVPAGSGTVAIQKSRWKPHPQTQTPVQPEDPSTTKLDATEIETMAAKQNEGTKRCFIRAQKGALGLEMNELKKIDVTLSVAKDGTVTDVMLSSHGTDTFGQCLIGRIKSWKFRESRGGTFRIALAFGAS
jgi:hypothetical protein